MRLQGSNAPSLLMETDQADHRRLRQQLSRFFTPENVESVYKTLQNAVARMTDGITQTVKHGTQPHACVDAFNFSHRLVNDVVHKV